MSRDASLSRAALTSTKPAAGKASLETIGSDLSRVWRIWVIRSPAGVVVDCDIVGRMLDSAAVAVCISSWCRWAGRENGNEAVVGVTGLSHKISPETSRMWGQL